LEYDDEANVDRSGFSKPKSVVQMLLMDEKTKNGEAKENVDLRSDHVLEDVVQFPVT